MFNLFLLKNNAFESDSICKKTQSKQDVFNSQYQKLQKAEPLLLQTSCKYVQYSVSLLSNLTTRKRPISKPGCCFLPEHPFSTQTVKSMTQDSPSYTGHNLEHSSFIIIKYHCLSNIITKHTDALVTFWHIPQS